MYLVFIVLFSFGVFSQKSALDNLLDTATQFCQQPPPSNSTAFSPFVIKAFNEYCHYISPVISSMIANLDVTLNNLKNFKDDTIAYYPILESGYPLYLSYKALTDPIEKRKLLTKWNSIVNETKLHTSKVYAPKFEEMSQQFIEIYSSKIPDFVGQLGISSLCLSCFTKYESNKKLLIQLQEQLDYCIQNPHFHCTEDARRKVDNITNQINDLLPIVYYCNSSFFDKLSYQVLKLSPLFHIVTATTYNVETLILDKVKGLANTTKLDIVASVILGMDRYIQNSTKLFFDSLDNVLPEIFSPLE